MIGNGVKRNRLLRRKNNIPRPPRIIRAPNVAHVALRATLCALPVLAADVLLTDGERVGNLMVVGRVEEVVEVVGILPFWITKKSMFRGISSSVPL